MIFSARVRNALAALTVILSSSSTAWSYPDAAELLTDFIHYAMIANVEMARDSAKALMDSGISDGDLAKLVDESGKDGPKRFEEAVARAQAVAELEAVASEIGRRVEAGRLELAREPKRIEEAVSMLTGVQRHRRQAEERLVAAGEYAVPPLVKQISEGADERLKLASRDILVKIGGPAVPPLCEAVLHLTGVPQRTVCDVLGTIRHPNAAPYLRELAMDEKADSTARDAARRAFSSLGVGEASLSALYADLARQYFQGHESLVAYPAEATNNVWEYNDFSGLMPKPVPTAIFSEVMAVRTSAKALRLDAGNAEALTLFVAANLKRENDLPEGAADPVYGESKYSPSFYATVFGTQTCLDVLGLAIDSVDTPLVRDAISALSKSTGGANLFARGQGRQPLLEALTYPDRRVQYEAALTLARALPQQPFSGDYSVVPILASAVRSGAKSMALTIIDDAEMRNAKVAELEQLTFQIVGAGGSLPEVQGDIARAVGIDLIVVRANSVDHAKSMVDGLRALPKAAAVPIVILAAAVDMPALANEYRDNPRVIVVRANVTPEQLAASVDAVMLSASGGRITEAEAEQYAIYALAALENIAISRSPAYSIADAESALIDALDSRSGGTRMLVAKILALIESDAAQRKLFDAALAAGGAAEEQVELLGHAADSVRRWGDRSEKRHLDGLIDLIANSTGATAEAAATVHGALNLPTSDAVKLVPQN